MSYLPLNLQHVTELAKPPVPVSPGNQSIIPHPNSHTSSLKRSLRTALPQSLSQRLPEIKICSSDEKNRELNAKQTAQIDDLLWRLHCDPSEPTRKQQKETYRYIPYQRVSNGTNLRTQLPALGKAVRSSILCQTPILPYSTPHS